jgi:hypothetical protein
VTNEMPLLLEPIGLPHIPNALFCLHLGVFIHA